MGAGLGKLLRILRPICGGVMEKIDPQYEGPPEGVTVHPCGYRQHPLFGSGIHAMGGILCARLCQWVEC